MPRPSLTKDKKKQIARLLAEGRTRKEVGEYYGVHERTVIAWLKDNPDIEIERLEIADQIAEAQKRALIDTTSDAMREQYKEINEYKKLLSQSFMQSFKTCVRLMGIVNNRLDTIKAEKIDEKTLPNYVRALGSSLTTIKETYSELLSIDDLLRELDNVNKEE